MTKKRKNSILLIILLILFILGTITYLTTDYLSYKPKMPAANIDIQTQIINHGTINLRNAEYKESQIKVGYEVEGYSLKEYNVSCKLYSDKNLISTSGSVGGGLIELEKNIITLQVLKI